MFFQSIYQMMSAGTDLNINIRRTDGKLSVAVMPRRTTLKDEAGQAIVPLILNGTPMELDGQFLQIITTPLQKAQGILTNLETFEQQARLTATQGKATGTANDKKTKEARENRKRWKTPQTCGGGVHGRKILGSDNLLQAGQGTRRYGQAETDRGKDTGSAEGVVTGLPVS